MPELKSYPASHDVWTAYVEGNFKALVLTGRGNPAPVDDVLARVSPEQEGINLQFIVPQEPQNGLAGNRRRPVLVVGKN